MRVLYVNQWHGLGGAEISLLRVLEHLPRDEIQPALACPRGALAEEARTLGVEVFPIAFPPLWRGQKPSPHDLQRLSEAIASSDLVHAYSVRAGWYAGRLCRRLRVPMVWSIHDLFPYPWQRMWLRVIAHRYSHAVVAYSEVLQRQFGRGLAHKVHHIPHGVDVQTFVPLSEPERAQVRQRYETPADAPVVLHVGRIMPFKGQHLFLQMAQRLLTEHPNRHTPTFWLAGDDSMGDPRYAQRVREMSRTIHPSVRWLGFLHDIAPVIAAADVLVHCSTRPEPFGLVILEAMACGTAVVSANRGAPAEILEHGRTGLLSPPNDVGSLADAVCTLLEDGTRRQLLLANARRVVCERYTLQQHVRQLVGLYRSLL
ncbi:MAG: glycosyltransferase family 4 protein [Chthonomonadetes bacterium]|nr:glycosyltransferase family 4 protein [Chthonomonadetes bacterium]